MGFFFSGTIVSFVLYILLCVYIYIYTLISAFVSFLFFKVTRSSSCYIALKFF